MWSDVQQRIERFNRSHQHGDRLLVWPERTKGVPGVMSAICGDAHVGLDEEPVVPVKIQAGPRRGEKVLIPLTQVA